MTQQMPGFAMWQALESKLLEILPSKRAHNDAPRAWPPRAPGKSAVPLEVDSEKAFDNDAAWAVLGWAASLEVRGLLQVFASAKPELQADLRSVFEVLAEHTADDNRPMLDFVEQTLARDALHADIQQPVALSDGECVDWLGASLGGEEAVLAAWKYRSLPLDVRAGFEQELRAFEQTMASVGEQPAQVTESSNARIIAFPIRNKFSPQTHKLQLAADSEAAFTTIRDPEEGVFCGRSELALANGKPIEIEVYRFDDVVALYCASGELLLEVAGEVAAPLQKDDGYAEFLVPADVHTTDLRIAVRQADGTTSWMPVSS